jgi:hypothetical protein
MIEKNATILNEFPSDCCSTCAQMRKVVSQGNTLPCRSTASPVAFGTNDIDVS